MRNRSETIGALGRTPARQSKPPPEPPRGRDPDLPPPDRGALRRWIHGALFENTGLKFLSLVLAITVFLIVNTDRDREITVSVGVRYELPADKVLTSEQLDEVKVTLKGPLRRLRQFDARELGRIELDLRTATSGEVPITHDMIQNLPPGLDVTSISPRTVRVAFDRRVEKVVDVIPAIPVNSKPQHGFIVAEVKAVPATVKVRGGERLLVGVTSVKTSEISVDGHADSFEQLAELAPSEGVSVDPTQRVTVYVRVVEELVTKKLPNQAVALRGDGDLAKWAVTPAVVDVTLTGTVLAVEKAMEQLQPVVKLGPGDPRARQADVVVDGLPPGVGVRLNPERVRVTPR